MYLTTCKLCEKLHSEGAEQVNHLLPVRVWLEMVARLVEKQVVQLSPHLHLLQSKHQLDSVHYITKD